MELLLDGNDAVSNKHCYRSTDSSFLCTMSPDLPAGVQWMHQWMTFDLLALGRLHASDDGAIRHAGLKMIN